MDATATYVYCILHGAGPPRTARVPHGLSGATRPSIAAVTRSLSLVTATVPLESYGPGPLETALQDMRWVADVAIAHEAVVEHFARQAGVTVIPMKLFTMFTSDARAIEETRSRGRDLEAVAKRIAGCEEWAVRITRRAAPSRQRSGRDVKPQSGAAFLTAKKEARDAARAAAQAAAESAQHAFVTLASIARDARRRDDVPEGASTPPLLDAAFLVPATGRARFKAAVRKLAATNARAGAEMTLSGPWPSYNFVQQDGRS